MVPAALRSLKRSSRVVLGWFLTVLMITETPRGEILHGAPDRGRLTVIFFHFPIIHFLIFFHLPIISPTVVTRANPRLLGALWKNVSTGRGVAGVLEWLWTNEWNTDKRVSFSLESRCRKHSKNSVSSAARYAFNSFLVSSKRLYDIHVTWFKLFVRIKGDSTALQ